MKFTVPCCQSLLPQFQFWKNSPRGKSRSINNFIAPRGRGKHVSIIMMFALLLSQDYRQLFNLSRKKEEEPVDMLF